MQGRVKITAIVIVGFRNMLLIKNTFLGDYSISTIANLPNFPDFCLGVNALIL